jgi:hypothetical protein
MFIGRKGKIDITLLIACWEIFYSYVDLLIDLKKSEQYLRI